MGNRANKNRRMGERVSGEEIQSKTALMKEISFGK